VSGSARLFRVRSDFIEDLRAVPESHSHPLHRFGVTIRAVVRTQTRTAQIYRSDFQVFACRQKRAKPTATTAYANSITDKDFLVPEAIDKVEYL
jgi:hypothetical protein